VVQRRWLGIAVVATALASAGCGPDGIGAPRFVSSPSGESVLFKAGGPSGVWLRRRSLENGALLASAWVGYLRDNKGSDRLECTPALAGRLWCLENKSDPLGNHGLRVRDEESLKIIAKQDEILRRAPELADERPFRDMNVDPKTRGFRFESNDGYTWVIDPTTLVPSRLDEPVRPKPDEYIRGRNGDRYGFPSAPRRAPLERNGVKLHPEHTYLQAEAYQVENWPRLLVVEPVRDHGRTLWCLFLDGAVDWKVTHWDDAWMYAAKLYRDTVVIVTGERLVALRPQDGAVVWTAPP
jgi:hypothetical protein